jgi:hypothetical protein
MYNWVNRYACFRSVFLCLLYIAASCENASQFDRANDRYGANSTHNSYRNRLVRLLTMPNCFDKQAARHSYTYTHHVANLFQNIYTPTFPSSICVCSLSCILINHFPLYTPAHTHTHTCSLCHSILSSSSCSSNTTCYSLNGHTHIYRYTYISTVKSV